MNRLVQALRILREINSARYIGKRAAADRLLKELDDLDRVAGYSRSKDPPELPLQRGQSAGWRRKWDRDGNPLVPGVEPRGPRGPLSISRRVTGGAL